MALSPYQQMLTSALGLPSTPMTTGIRPMAGLPTPAMSTGVPEDPMRSRLAALKAQYAGGDVDPRMTALLDRRMQRITEQETEAKEERRRTPWEALMRAGTAMASSQSPFFSQALSAGISEGMGTLQQRRLEAIKQRTGFGDARDAVEMERIKNEIDVRKTSLQNMRDDRELVKGFSEQDKAALDAETARIKNTYEPQEAAARIAKLEADVKSSGVTDALNRARIGTEGAQAAKYRAEAANPGGSGGRGTMFERRGEEILRTLGENAYSEFLATGKVGSMAPSLTPTQRGVAAMKLQGLRAAEEQIKRLAELNDQNPAMTGPLMGRIPSALGGGTSDKYEKTLAAARKSILGVTRVPGIGSMSDYETKLDNALLPERSDSPAGRKEALRNAQELLEFTRAGYEELLGVGAASAAPDAGQRLSPEQAARLPKGSKFIGLDGTERTVR